MQPTKNDIATYGLADARMLLDMSATIQPGAVGGPAIPTSTVYDLILENRRLWAMIKKLKREGE